jgi:hypothetical protein
MRLRRKRGEGCPPKPEKAKLGWLIASRSRDRRANRRDPVRKQTCMM